MRMQLDFRQRSAEGKLLLAKELIKVLLRCHTTG